MYRLFSFVALSPKTEQSKSVKYDKFRQNMKKSTLAYKNVVSYIKFMWCFS